jgi:Deoxyribonuclease II
VNERHRFIAWNGFAGRCGFQRVAWVVLACLATGLWGCTTQPASHVRQAERFSAALARPALSSSAPAPLSSAGQPVNWWFVFKFNAKAFPLCGTAQQETCPFGGVPSTHDVGQQFVFATDGDKSLTKGSTCLGQSQDDPLGATFAQIYTGKYHYVVWNDQFYNDPPIPGCSTECSAPWAHSKGMVAWDDNGDGVLLQVTTPSWPGSGSAAQPRAAGNTLGCVSNDNNIKFSQHFFALRLTKDDLAKVLKALGNASVATDPTDAQIVANGGPADIQSLVVALGKKSTSTAVSNDMLSSGVEMISKPSALHVPPWQMVSATLGGVSLKVANWWVNPGQIPDTTASTPISCWDASLGKPGAVVNATSGQWDGVSFGLEGGASGNHNHAKVAASTDSGSDEVIFGDMNQDGALSGNCKSSQNGRGGLFFVVHDSGLNQSLLEMMSGP